MSNLSVIILGLHIERSLLNIEKILKLSLKRREESIYQNIQDKIDLAIKAKHLDTREYIANLLDMHILSILTADKSKIFVDDQKQIKQLDLDEENPNKFMA